MEFARWLRRSRLIAAPAVALAVMVAAPRTSVAQEDPDPATVEELEEIIRARDAVIDDLRRRVDGLERRLGTAPAPPTPAPAPPAAAAPEPPVPAEAQAEAPPAPGQFEVDEEAADRALERALVQTGALLLRPGTVEVDPSFSYVRREDDTPVLVRQDGEPVGAAEREVRSNEFEAALALRLGLPFESQLEVALPYDYEDQSTVTPGQDVDRAASGLGDVSVSLAKGLLRERGWRPDLIGRVRWDSDTGQTDDGVALGSGFHELTGSLTAVKRQDPLVFVGTASYTERFEDDDVDPGSEIGFSMGTVLAASPETSLRFFLAQVFAGEIEVDGSEVDGSDQVSTSLILGASSVIAPRVLLDVTAGIGLTEDAPDYSVTVSVPFHFDLPFRF